MFLIDSSAWVEYLRPTGSQKVKKRVKEVLQKQEAAACGVVVVEILRGTRNDKDFKALRDSLSSLPQLPLDEEVIQRAAQWGFALDRKGKTVSTTDLLIASSAYKKATLLHLDSDFKVMASAFGLEEERL